jgi:endo-1,4-beta-xylanase
LDRRRFLKYASVGAIAGVAAGYCLRDVAGHPPWSPEKTTTVTQTTTEALKCSASLKAITEAKGFLIGSVADASTLVGSQLYADTLAREFNYVTTAYEMNWRRVHPSVNDWNFLFADDIVNFAIDHQMRLRGHTLIWYYADMPNYLTSAIPADEFRQMYENHIRTLVGHYKGKVHAWSAVNEAVDNDGQLRDTLFLEKLGEEYIGDAFRLAHEADPSAILLYTDYGAEALGRKSDGVYKLVKGLLADGVPIHSVGLQMHIGMDPTGYPKPEEIARNIRRLTALGLSVEITEMDVQIRHLPGTLQERLETERKIYHDIIAACLKEKGFTNICFCGFTDADSWIRYFFNEPDEYPLLFDEKFEPKPAYWGVMEALLEQ